MEKCGAGKRITSNVRHYLEAFFLAGNIDKTNRMTATEMVKELEILVEKNEITTEEMPSIKRVENWIAAYAAGLRREAAAEKCSNFEESSLQTNRESSRTTREVFIEIAQDSNNKTTQEHNNRKTRTHQTYNEKLDHKCENFERQSSTTTKITKKVKLH